MDQEEQQQPEWRTKGALEKYRKLNMSCGCMAGWLVGWLPGWPVWHCDDDDGS